ncbi:MAG: hypothetical protein ACXV5L_02020 [Thermoanaerobaculia bacterium]
MTSRDRRQFQRLKLAKPLMALLDGQNALVLDIGISGAFIEHYGKLHSGGHVRLMFRWQGADVEFLCSCIRSNVVGEKTAARTVISQTALHFEEPVGDATERLQEMMATFVGRILAAQKANASATQDDESDTLLAKIGEARRTRMSGFMTYRLNGTKWSRSHTMSLEQPPDGFTVAAYEDEEDLEVLCRAYERADKEGQHMIRVIAELSAMTVKVK